MLWIAAATICLTPAAAAEPAPARIVAFGDSLTAGYGLPAQDAFPVKLQAALKAAGVAATVANAGVSGDTASAGAERLDWSIPADAEAVIVELGANDALRGVDPAVTRTALDRILKRLGERKLPVLLAGMRAPPNMGADYGRQFDGIFSDLATKHGVLLYPFFLEGVAADAKLNQADSIHPNAQGVDIIVRDILPKVRELAEQALARRPS